MKNDTILIGIGAALTVTMPNLALYQGTPCPPIAVAASDVSACPEKAPDQMHIEINERMTVASAPPPINYEVKPGAGSYSYVGFPVEFSVGTAAA